MIVPLPGRSRSPLGANVGDAGRVCLKATHLAGFAPVGARWPFITFVFALACSALAISGKLNELRASWALTWRRCGSGSGNEDAPHYRGALWVMLDGLADLAGDLCCKGEVLLGIHLGDGSVRMPEGNLCPFQPGGVPDECSVIVS